MTVIAMYEPKFDRDSYQSLVLYLVRKFERDPYFGSVKLNKLLYFCDTTAYSRWFKPITGATYVNLREGPVVDNWKRERAMLLRKGVVDLKSSSFFDYVQHRLVPTPSTPSIESLTELFGPREVDVMNEVCYAMRDMSARDATVLSHQHPGWLLTDHLEPIPYELSLVKRPEEVASEALDEIQAVNHD